MAEMQQLEQQQGKLEERVLERAAADPEWKRQYIEDPQTALADMPEAQRLWEMVDSAKSTEQQPPEATVVTPTEEHRQLQQSLTEKVLDRAASDPLWKQRLLSDTEAAMREADFPEVKRLDEIRQEEEKEVRGHFSQEEHVNLMSLEGTYSGSPTGCSKYSPTCYYKNTRLY